MGKRDYLPLSLSDGISVRLALSRRRSLAAVLSRNILEGDNAIDILARIHSPLAELDRHADVAGRVPRHGRLDDCGARRRLRRAAVIDEEGYSLRSVAPAWQTGRIIEP